MKPAQKSQQDTGAASFGTVSGEKVRSKANNFSDDKRDALMARGMALIYGDNGPAKAKVNNR